MSVPLTRTHTSTAPWALALLGAALTPLSLQPGQHIAYLVALTVAVVAAATWIAIDDHRTGLLRNRYTLPFAAAGLIQVVIASIGTRSWAGAAVPCLIGAAITTTLYFLLGLLGWVGFGDVKFATGLALFAAIPAGWYALYLLPLAVTISALAHLSRRAASPHRSTHSAHGPALAAALAVLMTAACIAHP